MLDDFKRHPAVAPIIAGGTVVEHSGHMVAEAGYDAMPPLVADGVLLAGESALMCVNAGYTVRGMDFAIAAGQQAGRSAAAALEAGDTSAAGLAGYRAALEESFVLQDLKTLAALPALHGEHARGSSTSTRSWRGMRCARCSSSTGRR